MRRGGWGIALAPGWIHRRRGEFRATEGGFTDAAHLLGDPVLAQGAVHGDGELVLAAGPTTRGGQR
eukprot:322473-Prorocentrum_minimum.AAC.1